MHLFQHHNSNLKVWVQFDCDGLLRRKKTTSQVLTSFYHPTRWTSHQQIPFFSLSDVRKWLPTQVAFPHWVLISDCPLIHLSLWEDWPPQPPVDDPPMHSQICSQEGTTEEKITLLRHCKDLLLALCPASSIFYGRGMRNTPSLGKWLQLTILLITIAQNKTQAEKSLDGNCYNCPNNRDEYFFLLNYMWLNI